MSDLPTSDLSPAAEALLDKLCGCSWLMQMPGRGFIVERDRVRMRALLAAYTAKVREEDAKVCESIAEPYSKEAVRLMHAYDYEEEFSTASGAAHAARECAAAIRARGGEEQHGA